MNLALVFEHRLYLPLAGVCAAVVLGAHYLVDRTNSETVSRLFRIFLITVVATLGVLTFFRNHDYRYDLTIWKDTVAKRPDNPRAHVSLGAALLNHGEPEKAAEHFKIAIGIRPDYAKGHNNLGVAYLHLGRYAEAMNQIQEAVRLEPGNFNAYINLALAYSKMGELDLSIENCRKALRLKPDFALAHSNIGVALMADNRIDEAIVHLKRALELSKGMDDIRVVALINLGIGYSKIKQIDTARAYLLKALKINPREVNALMLLKHLNAPRTGDSDLDIPETL